MQPVPDLTNCDQEPIQWPGFIQSHGYLLALDPATFTIWQASQNCRALTNLPTEQLIGKTIRELNFGDQSGASIQDLLVVAMQHNTPEAFNPYPLTINGEAWYVLLHLNDEALILELEPTSTQRDGLTVAVPTLLAQTMSETQRSQSLTSLFSKVAPRIREITAFDRVMIYRFNEDWHGEVIAEDHEPHLEPFLGLHYPASDIPRQAREMYKINLVRNVVDVNEPQIPVYPVHYGKHQRPLDLTHASLRAVSTVHIEYLRNMGVQSSMSISLMYRGELWGLIACHHYSGPRFVDYPTRQSVKLISQLLSTALEIRKDDDDADDAQQLQTNEQVLYHQMLADWDVVQGLMKHPVTALDINSATGVALLFEGQIHTLGSTPSDEEITKLVDWLAMTSPDPIFQTHQLPNLYSLAEAYRDKASGLLALVISREMNEYLLWFKPEQIQTVSWAGKPEKAVAMSETGELRLSPRKSFAKWSEQVHNKSLPWRQVELAAAFRLREDLLQLVSQKANQIRSLNEQLRLAYEELDAFSYTVSHDLRTPLSSIKRYIEIYLEDYGEQMDGEAKILFDKVINASDRMSMLIRNVMRYSRTGRNELTAEPLAMQSIMAQVYDEIKVAQHGSRVNIIVGATPTVYGDQTMVTQVFSNLLSNAVKYTRHVDKPRVLVEGRENEHEVIYSVTDNGIGIDMKQAGKVFELFKRLDSAAEYEGYGVGLAIVKRIMNRHKGKVWFESTPHQTTTFYVSFPKIAQ